MIVVSWIVDFISTIIEVGSMMFFCGFFADRDKLRKKHWMITGVTVLFAIAIWLQHQVILFSEFSFINWIVIAVVAIFIFRKRLLLASALSCCVAALNILLDLAMCYLVSWICGISTSVVLDENSIYRMIVIIFSKVLVLLIMLLLYLMMHKTAHMPMKYLVILGAAMVVIFFVAGVSVLGVVNLEPNEADIFPVLFYFVTLLFLVAVFFFMIKLVKHYEERERYAIIKSRNDMLESSLQETKRTFEQWRRSIHDYKNTIHALYMLANAGNMEELKAYLEKENETLKQQVFYTHTGNSFVDAIVYAKSNLAKEKGIPFRVIGMLPESCSVSGIHLATILGNLIDHALEAGAGEENPFVELRFKTHGSMLMLYVSNALTPELKLEGTAKARKEYHGIGLSSVKALIRQYHGTLDIEQKKGVVTASVLLECFGKSYEKGKE